MMSPFRILSGITACTGVGLALFLGTAWAAPANVDEWRGVWKPVQAPSLLKDAEGRDPPLLPAARKVYEANIKSRQAGDLTFDSTEMCMPPGLPRLLTMSPFKIVPQAHIVGILYEWNHLVRYVYMEPKHESNMDEYSLYLGDSIGRWEGDELVVDTIGIDTSTMLDAALPHSDKIHLTERYRVTDKGKTLSVDVRLEDPEIFSRPWNTTLRFSKQPPGADLKEDVCVDRVGLEPSPFGAVKKKR